MSISLEELKNLSALNPRYWDEITQEELDARLLQSGIHHPIIIDDCDSINKSLLTVEVSGIIRRGDPELFTEIFNLHPDVRVGEFFAFYSVRGFENIFMSIEEYIEVFEERLKKRRKDLTDIASKSREESLIKNHSPQAPRM